MDRQRGRPWTLGCALIRRPDGHVCIVQRHTNEDAPWEFPNCQIPPRARPEDTLRRHLIAQLGIEADALLPQPPLVHHFGTHSIEYRYFLCPVQRDEATPVGYAALRWVLPAQLRDYTFDPPTQQVVDRLLAADQAR